LANPPKMFKGVNMPLALRDPGERAAVIAYLETLR
jgi:cytochrome c2